MLHTAQQIADEFRSVMREWLTAAELSEIDLRNAASLTAGDSSICHSHDFCDSNQAMIDALDQLGIEFNPQDEKQCELINSAWAIAKQSGFAK